MKSLMFLVTLAALLLGCGHKASPPSLGRGPSGPVDLKASDYLNDREWCAVEKVATPGVPCPVVFKHTFNRIGPDVYQGTITPWGNCYGHDFPEIQSHIDADSPYVLGVAYGPELTELTRIKAHRSFLVVMSYEGTSFTLQVRGEDHKTRFEPCTN